MLFAASSTHAHTGTALVRHAPTLNGDVEGSIHQLTAENATLNGGASITGDLFVPGLPTIRRNGNRPRQLNLWVNSGSGKCPRV